MRFVKPFSRQRLQLSAKAMTLPHMTKNSSWNSSQRGTEWAISLLTDLQEGRKQLPNLQQLYSACLRRNQWRAHGSLCWSKCLPLYACVDTDTHQTLGDIFSVICCALSAIYIIALIKLVTAVPVNMRERTETCNYVLISLIKLYQLGKWL